jgi:putative restriction endonuclease
MAQDYLYRFAHLHTQKNTYWSALTRNKAPNKPLLLLTVLDLFAQGTIRNNLIEPNAELGEIFAAYWELVMPSERRGNLAMPFFHLRKDGFWHLIVRPDREARLATLSTMTSLAQVHELLIGAKLDDELYMQLHEPAGRTLLRTVLVESYFASALHGALLAQSETNVEAFRYSQALIQMTRTTRILRESPDEESYEVSPARSQGFRRVVVAAYEHRCAFCGIRMQTADGRTVVDAAHIKPWSISHSDDPRNGLALCRLCHWAFDAGLLGVSERYAVLTASHLSVAPNLPGHLATLAGRYIFLPADDTLFPDHEMLKWHRSKRYGEH